MNIDKLSKTHDKFIADIKNAIRNGLESGGSAAIARVRSRPPFNPQTGKLQRMTRKRVLIRTYGGRLLLINNAKYASYIQYGTRPHIIRAKKGKYLRFRGRDGNWVFRKSVFHPGTRPYRFLSIARDIAVEVASATISREAARIAAKF